MSINVYRKVIYLLVCTSCTTLLHAQSGSTDTATNAVAIGYAIQAYHQRLAPETNLYNGSEYVDYAYAIQEGIPFFKTAEFTPGTVDYDSVLYHNVPLLYDEVTGEVIIRDYYNRGKIKLHPERVASFSLLNHHFVKLLPDSAGKSPVRPGFYDVLYDGNIKVYKREIKKVLESVTVSLGVRRTISEEDNYFIKKGAAFYTVNNKKSVLKLMKDKKKEVQQFIRKNKLNIRNAKDAALPQIAAYYDQLTTK